MSESPRTRRSEPPKSSGRVFLVVVDELPELKVALRYACPRAKKTGGRVALLYVIESADFQQWVGVGELMREEARQEAEQTLQKIAADVQKQSAAMPVLYVREGERRDELLKLIDEEPTISILVLGAATGAGPGTAGFRAHQQVRRQAARARDDRARQPVARGRRHHRLRP